MQNVVRFENKTCHLWNLMQGLFFSNNEPDISISLTNFHLWMAQWAVWPGLAETPLYLHVPAKTHNLMHILFQYPHFQLHNLGSILCTVVCHSTPISMVLKVSPFFFCHENCIKNKFTDLKITSVQYLSCIGTLTSCPKKSQCLVKALNGTLWTSVHLHTTQAGENT